ncbi:MAG: polysaccharide biosynthesis C-terminal domain-containing protein [Thermoplasmata archaeon]|nr:polysaccharide biosynthesis C-terminal domain-containing protein [Thermoplasmata archaeon]
MGSLGSLTGQGVAGAGPTSQSTPPAVETARPIPRPLAINSTVVFVITLAIQLLGYIPTFFLARGLATDVPEGLALFGTVQTFMLVASSVSSLGDLRLGAAYTFFVSRGESARRATPTYLVIRLGMVASAGLIVMVLAQAIGLSTSVTFTIFAVWMVLPLLWTASMVYFNLWTSLGDSARGQYPQLVEAIVRAAVLTYVAIYILDPAMRHGAATPASTLWAMTLAYVAGAAASALYSLRSLIRYRGRPERTVAVRLFRWSWPLLGSLALLYLSGNLINFFVIHLGPGAFGIFNTSNAFRTLLLSLPAAIAVPLFPHLSALHKEDAYEAIRSRTWLLLRYTAMLIVPGVVVLVIYRVNLPNIVYSGTFVSGSTALAILGLSAVPAALSQIVGTTLTSIGRTRLELYITSLQVACLSAVAFLLVQPPPALASWTALGVTGLNGAALAVLISSIAALLLNTYYLYTLLGVRIQLLALTRILASAAASFFADSRLNSYLVHVSRYYQLAAGIVLGSVVYAVVLILSGELSKQDVMQVSTSLGLPERLARPFARLCWNPTARPVNPLPESGARALAPIQAQWMSAPEEGMPPPGTGGPPLGPL